MRIAAFLTRRIVFAAGILLGAAQYAHAADMPPGPDAMHDEPHAGPHIRMDMHGGPMDMGAPVPPFLHGIELSEAQQDKIFDILHNLAPQMRERAKAAGKARQELHTLATSQNYDEARAKSLIDTLARTQADMMLMHMRADRQILALLTPEQRQQLDERKNRRPADGKPSHP